MEEDKYELAMEIISHAGIAKSCAQLPDRKSVV